MKLAPVTKIPKDITRRGPNRPMIVPTNGEIIPPSPRWRESAAAVAPLLQPKVATIGLKKAVNPRQKVAAA